MEVEIDWHDKKVELLESDIDERMEVYIAYGTDEAGKSYTGTAYFFCDELYIINEIERID